MTAVEAFAKDASGPRSAEGTSRELTNEAADDRAPGARPPGWSLVLAGLLGAMAGAATLVVVFG